MYLSKCLLLKSRRLLVDVSQSPAQYVQGPYDPENNFGLAPSSPNIITSQRHNSQLNLVTNSSFGSSQLNIQGASVASTGVEKTVVPGKQTVLLTLNAMLESNTVWQKEMEKGYDSLLETMLPLLGDSTHLGKLQR